VESSDVVAASRRLAEALRPGDLDETLQRITGAAVEVLPGVDHASITVQHPSGRLETYAPTHDVVCPLDAAQYELEEGPCYDTAVFALEVSVPDLSSDDRYPRYAPQALGAGIRAQAGVRLFDGQDFQGALNLYSTRTGSFQELGTVAELFAHQTAVALRFARQITQLREAVTTRQLIGRAVGVLMERFHLDEARAFGFLSRLSQDNNVKLREVAEQLLRETGHGLADPDR
jgi:GAF domain-containing protein